MSADRTTRDRLLDAAEALAADFGVGPMTVRAVTAAAGTNLASVHYYFGSKDELIVAVFARRCGPVNEERLRRLDALEQHAQAECPDLEAVLSAFIEPVITFARGEAGGAFLRLMGRVHADPDPNVKAALVEQFAEVFERFARAFARALPHLERAEVLWRMHCAIGVMAHTLLNAPMLETATRGEASVRFDETLVDRLVAFVAAGMRAPAPADVGRHDPHDPAAADDDGDLADNDRDDGGGAR